MALAERRRIRWLLAAATLVPIVVLSWLALRVLNQDRAVEAQRSREEILLRANRLALGINREFQSIEARLARGEGLQFTPDGIVVAAGPSILYQPAMASVLELTPAVFLDGEREEFQRENLRAAAEIYRRLTSSPTPAVRAGALLRLARVQRQTGDHGAALETIADLQRLDTIQVAEQPAALVARQMRCRVFEATGNRDALATAARELALSIQAGSWRIDKPTFENYAEWLASWGAPAFPDEDIARTEVAARLWRSWRAGDLAARGRRTMDEGEHAVLAVWDGNADRMSVWVAATTELEDLLRPLWTGQAVSVAAVDANGRRLFGEARPGAVPLLPAETELPFVLSVASDASGTGDSIDRSRRTVLVGSLLGAFALMIGAAVGLYRTTTRELMLVRQQSDFVSAVSHEFRTPLTSMRHLTELLSSGNVATDERKSQYYDLLSGETERLHRMVETLLSFGRIEAGAYAWKLEPHNAATLFSEVVEDFRGDTQATARSISTDLQSPLPVINVDREALTRALWNLLENAVKYSAPGTPIHVKASAVGDRVRLDIRDEGVGIPREERERIFQKFVRGSDASKNGVRGVGVGLALVKHIIDAHGGSIAVDSEPGRGSTFTVILPCLRS